ncbi:MAG: lipoyl(octanoyl) transferase LipB [Gammaproteobacteria bacterium]|nr:lipoyl(octanoyl) transferase LipB [Gammaproteobacteria bacterium]
MSLTSLVVRELGLCEYETTMVSMQTFTNRREKNTQDEIWLLQHPPVFTRGVSCRQLPNRLLPSTMKVVDSDRGGQITYHGPGQLVVYLLLDLRRRQLGVRSFVSLLETVIIDVLGQHGLEAGRRPEAPGVYVGGAKIAALGLRVRSGGCYHGMSLNIDLDLSPFSWIDPCGYAGLAVTSVVEQGVTTSIESIQLSVLRELQSGLDFPTMIKSKEVPR